MLDTLRRIVQEVTNAENLDQALKIIVARVKRAMGVEVCSVYLKDKQRGENILMASDGLNAESIGTVRLHAAQGLIGLVGEREEPLNLADAPSHPRFEYFPETGEEHFHSFLGVPIIHHRQLLGVLVVQRRADAPFGEDSVSFLVTVAAQLAGAIAHAEASGGISGLSSRKGRRARSVEPLQGQPGAAGVAMGTVVVCYHEADLDTVPDREVQDSRAEVKKFKRAVEAVSVEIQAMLERMESVLPAE
ncbi:MAG TPA: GAF domain-containing protein, partial [Gammaproteobacteria bacterium]|nr:GAF domain-containing protein [Gammaproteobacteria bacterium]